MTLDRSGFRDKTGKIIVAAWRLAVFGLTSLLLASGAARADADAPPRTRAWAEFAGLAAPQLVSEFIRSYAQAGYRLKSRQVRALDDAGRDTQLEFEYRFAGDLRDKTGRAVFYIRSTAGDACDPCSVYTELLAPEPGDYGEDKHLLMKQQLHAADHAAATRLLKKLKKNFRIPALPPERCPDPFKCLAV